jgi:cytochrome c oxidase assembly factor CtaG
MVISGFICTRAVVANIPGLRIESSHARIFGFIFAGVLLLSFAMMWRKKPGLANAALFAAIWIAGSCV